MKAIEFSASVSREGMLEIPTSLRDQICLDQPVRVLLLLPESGEAADWARLTAEKFLQGYDASDAIYDELHAR